MQGDVCTVNAAEVVSVAAVKNKSSVIEKCAVEYFLDIGVADAEEFPRFPIVQEVQVQVAVQNGTQVAVQVADAVLAQLRDGCFIGRIEAAEWCVD